MKARPRRPRWNSRPGIGSRIRDIEAATMSSNACWRTRLDRAAFQRAVPIALWSAWALALLGKMILSPRIGHYGFVLGGIGLVFLPGFLTLPPWHAYGVMMAVSPNEVRELYAESSVADYVPASVTVELMDGSNAEASCYNLPSNKVTGTNKGYAEALLEVANRLVLRESYLGQVRQAGR